MSDPGTTPVAGPSGHGPRRHPSRSRALVALVVAALAVAGCSGAAAPGSSARGDPELAERLAGEATGAGAFAHLQALQAIADRHGGNRALGTPGYDESVDYVADTLREAGYRVETPTFMAESEDGGRVATRNVVAQTSTGRPDEVVLSGAHLDSVPAGPGINDDGSGTAAQLEIALRLGSAPPVSHAVRFVWFGAEEEGLLGSKRYVDDLSDEQRRDIAMMFNSDMVGSPNAAYLVYDGDRSDGGDGSEGPEGSAAIERLLTERLASLGVQARGAPFLSDDSDYAPFVDAGIPTGGVFTGDAGKKTPEQVALWGGRPGVAYDPCYHRACDTVANVDRVAFGRMLGALSFAVGSYAVDLGGVPARADRSSG